MADLQIRHGFTPKILTGGSVSVTTPLESFKRAKTSQRPKVHSPQKYRGDHVLMRSGKRGALQLGRMVEAMLPKVPQAPKGPQNGGGPQQVAPQSRSGPTTTPSVPTPSSSPTTPTTFAETLTGLRTRAQDLAHDLDTLHKTQPDGLSTPKERVRAETELIGRQSKVQDGVDTALGDVGKLMNERIAALKAAEATPPPDQDAMDRLKTEIADLKALRRDLIATGIRAEFGGLTRPTLTHGGVVTALWHLRSGVGTVERATLDPQLGPKLDDRGMGTLEIGRLLKDYNAGRPVVTDDGSTLSPDELQARIDTLADTIDRQLGHDPKTAELRRKAVAELRRVSAQIGVAVQLEGAIRAFEDVLDTFQSTYDPPQPPAANPFPDGFPLKGAMIAIASALPHGRAFGNSTDPRRLEAAAESVRVFATAIARGETGPILHGRDLGFDKAVLPLKQAWAGAAAVQHLRDQRAQAGDPLPADAVIALLGKTDEQLTSGEREQLLALVPDKPGATLADAREVLEAGKTALDEARENGATTAAMRHELTLLDIRFSRLLTVDRSKWYKPWTWGTSIRSHWYKPNAWGAGERLANSLASVKIDAQFMKALRSWAGPEAGREIAILTARYAVLQEQTILSEQQVLGLHVGYDINGGARPQTPSYEQADPTQPLKHFGISNNDLREVGLSDGDIGVVGSFVEKLTRQGIASLEQVHDVGKALNDVSRIVLRSELLHESLLVYEHALGRAQGDHLLTDILTDADLSYRKGHLQPPREGRGPPQTTDRTVDGHFRDRVRQVNRTLGEESLGQMKLESNAYRARESEVARLYSRHMELGDEITARRALLETAGEDPPDGLGLAIDPADPRGLRSAKQILIALAAQEEIDAIGSDLARIADKAAATARRDEALSKLRGFDSEQMKRPWHAKLRAPFTSAPEMQQLRKLRDVAEAIVFIREDAPMAQSDLEDRIADVGRSLDTIVALRREASPEAMAHVTTMIRAAVLAQWRSATSDLDMRDGAIVEGFDPSSSQTRQRIEATLRSWGLDIDAFAPEIDSALYSRLTSDDIARWRAETRFSSDMIALRRDERPVLSLERLIGRRVMNPQTRQTMLSLLEGFTEGDRLDLKAGQRITVDSGKIPVEPSGLVGIRARLAGAHIGQFEIELGSDGYKLHLRTGGEARGNVDVVVGKKYGLGANIEARLEASAGLEGSAGRLTGMTIAFDKGPQGREALVALVAKMIDGDKITQRDWQSALDVGYTYENRARGGASARGEARIAVGGKIDPDKGTTTRMDDEFIGVGLGAGVSAAVSLGGKWVGTDSLNQVTRKGEIELSTTYGANAGLYARFYNVLNMGTGALAGLGGQDGANSLLGTDDTGKPLYNITENVGNYDLLSVGLSVTSTSLRKWKLVTNSEGLITGCEKTRQSNRSSGLVASFASCLDTPGMLAILDSDKPEHRQFRSELQTFMKLKSDRDFIVVTYGPKPGLIDQANALIARAIAARRDGDEDLAARYEAAARDLVDDEANFYPTKIGLLTTDLDRRESTNINARFIRWDTFSDGKSEHRGIVMAIPPP